ncbi:MAG: hypothetical protein WCP20_04110 [Desulfuromonadales bacterium]
MTNLELKEEIAIELEAMNTIVDEAVALFHDISGRDATIREKTAAAAFMAQFYGGIENILKRIHRCNGITTPSGDSWHIEIFKRFCNSPYPGLPLLFDEKLAHQLAPFRKFRHIVYHGYGFQLEWERMIDGLEAIKGVHMSFTVAVSAYLDTLS